jgi:hypothetical protein
MHESFHRHNPQQKAKQMIQNVSSPVVCENCGKVLTTSNDAYNVMFVCQVGSPGNPALAAFQCDSIEHWACTPDCWKAVAHACIDQHMHETLIETLKQLEDRRKDYEEYVNFSHENSK